MRQTLIGSGATLESHKAKANKIQKLTPQAEFIILFTTQIGVISSRLSFVTARKLPTASGSVRALRLNHQPAKSRSAERSAEREKLATFDCHDAAPLLAARGLGLAAAVGGIQAAPAILRQGLSSRTALQARAALTDSARCLTAT